MLNLQSLKIKQAELALLAFATALLALAIVGPTITQPEHQHAFADTRTWAAIAHAMDVLSNIAFALWGGIGLVACYALRYRQSLHKTMLPCMRMYPPIHRPTYTRMHMHMRSQLSLAALFFTGLLFTAVASAFYHLQPVDAGLGVDRLGMVVAFAGLLGLATGGHVSARAGLLTTLAVLLLGPASIWFWLVSGNVLPWLVVQFGGMVLVVMVAFIKPLPGALQVRWAVVVLVYAVAKVFELADHEVYAVTNEVVSGHSLKHLIASLAAWPVLTAVRAVVLATAKPASASVQKPGKIRATNFNTRSL